MLKGNQSGFGGITLATSYVFRARSSFGATIDEWVKIFQSAAASDVLVLVNS